MAMMASHLEHRVNGAWSNWYPIRMEYLVGTSVIHL